MRPQQQNRRMRGRNNSGGGNNNNNMNNRKGPNPLTRNYESNGPDVKIRGSAQQIAEKYAQLARDSHSSGDRVMAENYLQHAEHYNRIIAAAQAQLPVQNTQNPRDNSDDNDNDEDRDDQDNASSPMLGGTEQGQTGQAGLSYNDGNRNGGGSEQPRSMAGNGPQPVIEGMPAEVALNPNRAENNTPRQRQPQDQGGGGQETDAAAPRRRERKPRRSRSAVEEEVGSDSGLAQTLARGILPEPADDAPEKSGLPLIEADS